MTRSLPGLRMTLLTVSIMLGGLVDAHASWTVEIETGAVISGYNDIRIPRSTGTEFSLSEELETNPSAFFRLRIGRTFAKRHKLIVLVAPLRLRASGSLNRPVRFEGVDFPAGVDLSSTYRFDSYRLTYRYSLYQRETLEASLGITVKIRDAEISLEEGSRAATKANTGFVPLLSFNIAWRLTPDFRLVLEGDALAAPQGRAEDVFLGFAHRLRSRTLIKAGYRLLEGGADVEETYNFALFHYLSVGAVIAF